MSGAQGGPVVRVAVVVGNPRPGSRTRRAAELLAETLTGAPAHTVVDVAGFGAALLDGDDPDVAASLEEVRSADVLIVASPTFKATYTGLLKVYLDRLGPGALRGIRAVPLMLGAAPHHALAPELHLRPVLTELGAAVPVRGLYVQEDAHDDPEAYRAWVEDARWLLLATPYPNPNDVTDKAV